MDAFRSFKFLLIFSAINALLLCSVVEGDQRPPPPPGLGNEQDPLSHMACSGDEDCNTGLPFCIEGVCGQCRDTGDCGNLECRNPSDKVPFTVCGDPHVRVKVPMSTGGRKDLCFDVYGQAGTSFTYLNMNGVEINATFAKLARRGRYRSSKYRRQKLAIHVDSLTMSIPGPSVLKVNADGAEVIEGNFSVSGGIVEDHLEGWTIKYENIELKVYRGTHKNIDFSVSVGQEEVSRSATGVMGIVSNEAFIIPWNRASGNLYFARSRVPDPVRWNAYRKCFFVRRRSFFVDKLMERISIPLTQERIPLTPERNPLTQGRISLTQGRTPLTAESNPLAQGRIPLTPERNPLTQGRIPLTKERIPLTRERSPLTRERIPRTQERTPKKYFNM